MLGKRIEYPSQLSCKSISYSAVGRAITLDKQCGIPVLAEWEPISELKVSLTV